MLMLMLMPRLGLMLRLRLRLMLILGYFSGRRAREAVTTPSTTTTAPR